ncbi:unnamed protein product [Brassica oleracea var. botrytis]
MLGILLNKLASGITVEGKSNNQVPSGWKTCGFYKWQITVCQITK